MINQLSWISLLLCLSVISTNSQAQKIDAPFFKVSPVLCITDVKQKMCEFKVQIHFRIAPYRELCLEITQRPQHTQCYTQTSLIIEKLNIKTEHPLTIKLINPLNNKIVQQQLLSIASYEAKDFRIKRRFGWSL
ncbi:MULTISPECIES: DUF3019 domain-containing protein [unclassified Pseudoalteromonas]|jgi:hypothetical protein|uniref:DUF3019 domain-containing protein n=1 Tax=unclassified Pseudoalteromonas TaxID=194690 RepID=UPI001F337D14|nr:DUF3019 domain-containing protein [Pseudoalteromonas sp. L1]WOC25521.1 DUF3019 domain-containing protein [Pseudoalteromonas sp. N1230-9]